ncbi:MAG: hypothetical protein LBV00_02705 [Propionibacteriaceae bacterium]|jgi:hypothetical protein|nr:hypothetical protein [Propionibacteriaceae bacterium]
MSGRELEQVNIQELEEVIAIIERARANAFRAVNREMVTMYEDIGEYISNKARRGE